MWQFVYGYGTVETEYLEFYLYDLDHDGVQELFLYCPRDVTIAAGFEKIYTYKNGKVKLLQSVYGGQTIYKKRGIVKIDGVHGGIVWTQYYKLKNGKLKLVADLGGNDSGYLSNPSSYGYIFGEKYTDGIYFYYDKVRVNGKDVSEKTYKNTVKKLLKNNAKKKIIYRQNTEANRRKYLTEP